MKNITQESGYRIPRHEDPYDMDTDKGVGIGKQYQTIDQKSQNIFVRLEVQVIPEIISLANQKFDQKALDPISSFPVGQYLFFGQGESCSNLCRPRSLFQTSEWSLFQDRDPKQVREFFQGRNQLEVLKGETMIQRVIKLGQNTYQLLVPFCSDQEIGRASCRERV